MAQTAPTLMIAHELNPYKGFVPSQAWVLDKVAPGPTNLLAGSVAYIDPTSGQWVAGVATPTANSWPVPHFLFQNGNDFDVTGQVGNISGVSTNLANGNPQDDNGIMGISSTGAYELETTEFVAAGLTRSSVLTGNGVGKLVLATVAVGTPITVCGVVSDGVIQSEFKGVQGAPSRLRFYTHFQVQL